MLAAAVAELLLKSGCHEASEELVLMDIDAGAPTNPDGSINLVHYAAWLSAQLDGPQSPIP